MALGVPAGYDDDLVAENTRPAARLRQALMHVHPALERVLGPRLKTGSVLDLLANAPTPAALAQKSAVELASRLHAPGRTHATVGKLVDDIQAALAAQMVEVPGTDAFGRVIGAPAARMREIMAERIALLKQIETYLDAYPAAKIYTSMPGIGSRCAARLIAIIGDGSEFPMAGHLASYAGLAPPRSSGARARPSTRCGPARRATDDLRTCCSQRT
ncbi:hypothetical protein GCM10009839_93560 [Catenulispora yoronensis]|uniref:Transposase IS116/IS110/IS902 C-terminal domain-containing protein n=1 Tax=Catenulispora yoronensis TaxID=450799 RepID=A0ABN2VQ37_9ACTN